MQGKMGTFRHTMEIAAAEDGPFVALDAVVDTGAAYSWVPEPILAGLRVEPRERRQFLLADGRVIERDLAIVTVRLDGRTQPTLCVVGDPGSQALLGAYTLEGFGLTVDPVNQRLVPLPYMYLLLTAREAVKRFRTTSGPLCRHAASATI